MPTIDEMVDTLKAADLKADVQPEPEAPIPPIELPLKAVKRIAKRIADPRKFSDGEIAAWANQKLGDWNISVEGPDPTKPFLNPIKARGHVAKIRAACRRRLAALQE